MTTLRSVTAFLYLVTFISEYLNLYRKKTQILDIRGEIAAASVLGQVLTWEFFRAFAILCLFLFTVIWANGYFELGNCVFSAIVVSVSLYAWREVVVDFIVDWKTRK
jgi:hypothetical protein